MTRFRVFRKFNKPELRSSGWKGRLHSAAVPGLGQRGRVLKVLQAIAQDGSLKFKEVLESFEVYACVHRRLNHPRIVDLCCGHGLTGFLFAVFGRQVEEVVLVDRETHPSALAISAALHRAFPELEGRVRRVTSSLQGFREPLGSRTGLVAVHACGSRTDQCLDLAIDHRCAIVAMPCCYTGTGSGEPMALRRSLGVAMATDIGRTYRLQREGYRVEWDAIPASITALNRVIIAYPT